MHSSRMRTARLLTVSQHALRRGVSAGGGHMPQGVVWQTPPCERRVPTRPGKPGKMRVHLENLEISWNFEKFNKYHGKMT